MKRFVLTGNLEEDLINLVFNRVYELQLKEGSTDNPRQFAGGRNTVKVNSPNDGFNTPILNISLRPINLLNDDDFGLIPSAFISLDSTLSSPPDAVAIDQSGERLFVRLEFSLNSDYGAPKTSVPENPNAPEDLTTQTARLMKDLRGLLSRTKFVNIAVSENVYIRDARIVRSMFDERVRNTDNEIYIIIFMISFSYTDTTNR